MTEPELRELWIYLVIDAEIEITFAQLRAFDADQLEELAGWLDAVLVFWRERQGEQGWIIPPAPEFLVTSQHL